MRSGVGSGAVLGASAAPLGAEAEPDGAALEEEAGAGAAPGSALGPPLPSARRPGKTSVGAPGSVE